MRSIQKACELDYGPAFFNLGYSYQQGRGVAQDYARMNELYSKACVMDYGAACFNLGVSYWSGKDVQQDKSRAKEFFGKSCDLSYEEGCDSYRELSQEGGK